MKAQEYTFFNFNEFTLLYKYAIIYLGDMAIKILCGVFFKLYFPHCSFVAQATIKNGNSK